MTLIGSLPLCTSDQRQHIFERLLVRNRIRHQIGVKPIDIPRMYHRKVHAIQSKQYDELLKPYLVEAFGAVDWPDSLTGRLLIAVRLHKRCVDQLEVDHGIPDPRSRQPDMIAMINRLVP